MNMQFISNKSCGELCRLSVQFFALVTLFALCASYTAQATDRTWDGGGSGGNVGVWAQKANWGGTSFPASGDLATFSSVVGSTGNAGQANYAASKAGIIGFTKSVALELGSRNIRSNAIAPGFIETEMTAALDPKTVEGWREGIPLKRGGTPEDIANATVFLASDMSAYITGQVLNVCGGMLT